MLRLHHAAADRQRRTAQFEERDVARDGCTGKKGFGALPDLAQEVFGDREQLDIAVGRCDFVVPRPHEFLGSSAPELPR